MNVTILNPESTPSVATDNPLLGEVQMIPFGQLRRSEQNVRTINPERQEDIRLLTSIQAVGLLQNLTVVIGHEAGCYEVNAGGRRFAALQELAKQNVITDLTPIPCRITTPELAVSVSLAENEDRADMHPADRFKAYRRLVDEGSTVADVANQFSVTPRTVEQMLRLSTVHKRLYKLFEKSKLELAVMIAYAATIDTKQQLAVFKQLGADANAHAVKRAITEGHSAHTSPLVRFVSLSAYKKAGGVSETDLFTDIEYLKDNALLLSLAARKLERAADKLKGWKWTVITFDGGQDVYRYNRISSHRQDVPQELSDECNSLQLELNTLDAMDEENWTDEHSTRYDQIEQELYALEKLIDDQYRAFDPDDMCHAGCLVTFDNAGKLRIIEGLQNDDDVKEQKRSTPIDKEEDSTDQSGDTDGTSLSQKLMRDLGLVRRAAIRERIACKPALAIEHLHFSIALRILAPMDFTGRDHYAVRIDVQCDGTSLDVDLHHTCNDASLKRYSQLELSWLNHDTIDEQFSAFIALSKSQRSHIVAWCAAQSFCGGTEPTSTDTFVDSLSVAFGVDVSSHWRPSADNYFGRVNKRILMEHLTALLGQPHADTRIKASKKELVAELHEFFHGPEEGLSDDQRILRNTWLPDYLIQH